jgi:hypothetical protein
MCVPPVLLLLCLRPRSPPPSPAQKHVCAGTEHKKAYGRILTTSRSNLCGDIPTSGLMEPHILTFSAVALEAFSVTLNILFWKCTRHSQVEASHNFKESGHVNNLPARRVLSGGWRGVTLRPKMGGSAVHCLI